MVHESTSAPLTQAVTPSPAHTPVPQCVTEGVKSSSTKPSQSSSYPLHRSSSDDSPGAHVSSTVPSTQLVAPVRAQTPRPQFVMMEAYSSSTRPSQSSSR